jgi:biopolymer transport protein TolQ
MDFIHIFLDADIIVQAVIVIMILGSIISWKIVFEKNAFLARIAKDKNLVTELSSSPNPLALHIMPDDFITKGHPASKFLKTIAEQQAFIMDKNIPLRDRRDFLTSELSRLTNNALDKLEEGVGFLATVGSTMPFIGLFGTVWGIMNSFRGIAASKSTSLDVVAPGIAEALLATAIGLITAIPAVIFYNKINTRIAKFGSELDNLANHLAKAAFVRGRE